MGDRKKTLQLNKIQGPGFLKYDLSKIPPKLRRKSGNRPIVDSMVDNQSRPSACSEKKRKCANLEEDSSENVPTDIEDSHMNVLASSTLSFPVEDHFKLYQLGIVDSGYFCPCNANHTLFAVADYDQSSRQMKKHRIHTVRKKAVNFKGNSITTMKWIYCCSCNEVFAEYVDTLSLNLHNSSDDFQEMNCFHIEVVKHFTSDVIDSSPDDCLTEHSYGRVDYDRDEKDFELLELPFGFDYCLVNCGIMPGVVTVSGKIVQCYTCQSGHCCHRNVLKSFFDMSSEEKTPDIVLKLMRLLSDDDNTKKTYIYSTVSKKLIEFRLSENLRESILHPLSNSIIEEGKHQFYSFENDNCEECGNPLGTIGDIQGNNSMPLFCKYEVFDVSVYCKKCSSCCKIQMFDGGGSAILNMRSFLIHHSILRDYMWHFLHARCTLYAYFNIWVEEMLDMGIDLMSKGMSYIKFRHSWYAFLGLLDINLDSGFHCDICGSSPSVIVCDATSLAFRKSFMTWKNLGQNEIDENSSLIEGSRYKDRILINVKKVRVLLQMYCSDSSQLDEDQFKLMVDGIGRLFPSVTPLLLILESIGCFQNCPPEHRPLLEILASSSPACALLPCTMENEGIIQEMLKSNEDISQNSKLLNDIQHHFPLLLDVVKAVGFKLSAEYKSIIAEVYNRSKNIFCISELKHDSLSDTDVNDDTAFFPALKSVRPRGHFKADKTRVKVEKCAKDSTRHPTLLPGIFTVFCKHGTCYGFQIMEANESPNVPFTFIRTRFQTAPSVIIYDNACNLHAYFLNRDPLFIKNTTFAVDKLHWKNHKSCSKVYNAKNQPTLYGVNTQMVEQNNSKLKKLKSQLSYMNHENFMIHLKFFLWYCNVKLIKKT